MVRSDEGLPSAPPVKKVDPPPLPSSRVDEEEGENSGDGDALKWKPTRGRVVLH